MTPEVVVVGGGLIGLSVASSLLDRGAKVTVLERSIPGAEASSVAAGILAPHVEFAFDRAMLRVGRESRAMHAAWAERFAKEHGIDVGFRASGVVRVAKDPELIVRELAALEASAAAVERLEGSALLARVPGLDPRFAHGWWVAEDGQVEPPKLLVALAQHVRARGGAVVRGTLTKVHSAPRGLEVVLGDTTLVAEHVVLAAGAWSGQLDVPASVRALLAAIRPVRGQVVHGESRWSSQGPVVFAGHSYVVPRGDGRIVCGATMEEAGFERDVTFGGIHDVLANAVEALPGLREVRLTGHAVNFRPASSLGGPLIGPTDLPGLWLATGHHRNGVLLAPWTGEILAEAIVRGVPVPQQVLPTRRAAQ